LFGVRLGFVEGTVSKIGFVFDFILHNAYTVDACALTSILPSLFLIVMIYGGHKRDYGPNTPSTFTFNLMLLALIFSMNNVT